MDDEKESLRRQIHQLQDLINSHKKIHGNAPMPPTKWRNPTQPKETAREGLFDGTSSRGYQQQQPSQGNSWRKKYSLVNRTQSAAERASLTTADISAKGPNKELAQKIQPTANAAKLENMGKPEVFGNWSLVNRDETVSKGKFQTAVYKDSRTQIKALTAVPSTSAQQGVRPIMSKQEAAEGGRRSSTEQKMTWTSSNKSLPSQGSSVTQLSSKRPLVSLPHTDVNCSPLNLSADTSKRQHFVPDSTLNSPKNPLRTVTIAKGLKSQKTKYTWVASPKTNLPGKKVSPSAKKSLSGDSEKVKSPIFGAAVKGRKSSAQQKCLAPKSRYKWRAESVTSSSAAPLTPSQSPINRMAQRLSPHTPHAKASHSAGNLVTPPFRDSAHSSYKIKSRTKIVRRRSLSRSPVEKSSPLAPLTMKSHYCLRRRHSPRVKSPSTVKRSSPRGLVHISKHRLRRLPPGKQLSPGAREATPSSPLKGSSSSRVIKTRYRIVKKNTAPSLVTSPWSALSSSLTWRTRLLLLNRVRLLSQSGRFQNQQRWRSRGLCFIGGVMYRVSANKLSKTWSPGTGGKQTPKTGKLDLGNTSPGSLYPSRSATPSRYIASRAVQRSLAIIRQAQQKKEKKEYCMYYNRFGKCNRGQKCPYIHDPEKVAVCTRFLRGTCKKTDGTCPFSHKVSKDKMPVCSYFLKGICRNNDCPYSHVYVSRKAEICQDFLKGYCPMGSKCKKKHTLLCPDYARDGTCPQGSKCKLQHRQRKRWIDSTVQSQPSSVQQRQAQEDSGSSRGHLAATCTSDVPSTSDEEPPGSSDLLTCPSFISLNCPSTSQGTPVSRKAKSAEDSGKPLQIKPRL